MESSIEPSFDSLVLSLHIVSVTCFETRVTFELVCQKILSLSLGRIRYPGCFSSSSLSIVSSFTPTHT